VSLKVYYFVLFKVNSKLGLMATPFWKTKDNFEMQIGVNYFAPFLLTNLLLDLLKKTGNSRIINVASVLHQGFLFQGSK
jgi:NAD(P)-dependent dehydrogenase (short-subunit alcohol dehydrogenase family)